MISQAGDGLFQLAAAAVLLFENPGPNPVTAMLGISVVTLIPFSVVAPFTGVFIDRWERRKILTRVPLLRAAVAALLPLAALAGTHSFLFYLVVLVVLSSNRFFLATMSAVLPQLVPEDDLLVANSVSTTGGSIANVAGQGVGAATAAFVGGERAAALAALAFIVSAYAARRVPAHRGLEVVRHPLREELKEVIDEMVDGLRQVRGHARVVYGLSAVAVTQVLVGVMVGVLLHYFIVTLGLSVGSATPILGVLALGIGLGVVLVPLIARHLHYDVLLPLSFGLATAATAVSALWLSRPAMLVGAGIVGIAYAFAKIPVDTIVQEEMADAVRGRAFAVYDMLFNVARVAGIGIAAWGYEAGETTAGIAGATAVAGAAATVGYGLWGGTSVFRKRKMQPPRLQAGEMVTVRAYAGARADEEPRVIVVGGHELPIDEIEWRAVVEEAGKRSRAFVVRVGGQRVRLTLHDDATSWEVERILPSAPPD